MRIQFHNFNVSQNQGNMFAYEVVEVVDYSLCSAGGVHCVGADKPHSQSPLQSVCVVCARGRSPRHGMPVNCQGRNNSKRGGSLAIKVAYISHVQRRASKVGLAMKPESLFPVAHFLQRTKPTPPKGSITFPKVPPNGNPVLKCMSLRRRGASCKPSCNSNTQ